MANLSDRQFAPILKSDLSSKDARRSREVSHEEFQQIAQKGGLRYHEMSQHAQPIEGTKFDQNFDRISKRAYKATREPWGGVTVDTHTGRSVPKSADAYAITVRPPGVSPVSVHPEASREEFHARMNEARNKYADVLPRERHHLGVFHDADTGRIDIDPVLVVKNKDEAEAIGAYTRNVGGAYHFKSGEGHWPPHVGKGSR